MSSTLQHRQRGFTLIELMVAVVVVGILAAAAYPAMTGMVKRSRRADAIAVLTAVVQSQERWRSNRSEYASSLGDEGLKMNAFIASTAKYYDLSLEGLNGSYVAGYTVIATPKSSGSQATDNDCKTMSVMLEGAQFRYLAKDVNDADSSSKCWSR